MCESTQKDGESALPFKFHPGWFDSACGFRDENLRKEIVFRICEYGSKGVLPPYFGKDDKSITEEVVCSILIVAKNTIDNERKCQSNGRRGGMSVRRESVEESEASPQRIERHGSSPLCDEELTRLREGRKISQTEFHSYFVNQRTAGNPDASMDNESKFWHYLLTVQFQKVDGRPITRDNVGTTFAFWLREERKNLKMSTTKEDKKLEEAKKEEERRRQADIINERALRSGF